MKKNSFLLFIFCQFVCGLFAQVSQYDPSCSTPDLDSATAVALPYFGNNAVVENYLVQNGYNNLQYISFPSPSARSGSFLETKYLVPLNIFIWRDNTNNPNSAIAEIDAKNLVCIANTIYQNAGTAIQFYVNRVEVLANDSYNNQISSPFNVYSMWASRRLVADNSKGINIHFIRYNNLPENNLGKSTLPHYPTPLAEYSLYVRTHLIPSGGQRTDEDIAATLAHEIGHTLGLLHTHHPGRIPANLLHKENGTISNGCYQESVSRVKKNYWNDGCLGTDNKLKCEINGDFLCDTQADPKQSGRVSSCNYIIPTSGDYREDNWGVLWTPPTHNVMSYTTGSCRSDFSRSQTGIMWMRMLDFRNFISYQAPTISSSSDQVCFGVSKNFSLTGAVPANATVSWQVQPAGLVNISTGSGSIATVSAYSSSSKGVANITFSIVGSGDCYLARFQKTLWVGTPNLTSVTYDGGLTPILCAGLYQSFTGGDHVLASVATGATSNPTFNLNTFGSPYVHGSGNGNNFNFNVNALHTDIEFTISSYFNNACGTTSTCTYFTNLASLARSFPNPSDNQITLPLGIEGELKKVSLYNSTQELVFVTETKNAELIFGTTELPDGYYVVRVVVGAKSYSHRIQIKH